MRIPYNKFYQKFREWLSRIKLTGLSVGPVGAQWETAPGEKEIGATLITFLEPRRALYADLMSNEFPNWVSLSIIEIRNQITSCISQMPVNAVSIKTLREMRKVCNTFLSKDEKLEKQQITGEITYGDRLNKFYRELASFREKFGYHPAILVSIYEVDVEEELASIFPF